MSSTDSPKEKKQVAFSTRLVSFSNALEGALKTASDDLAFVLLACTSPTETEKVVVFASGKFEAMTGFDEATAVGEKLSTLLGDPPQDQLDVLDKAVPGGPMDSSELATEVDAKAKDGHSYKMMLEIIPVFSSAKEQFNSDLVICICSDVSKVSQDAPKTKAGARLPSEPMSRVIRLARREIKQESYQEDEELEKELTNVECSFAISDAMQPDTPLTYVSQNFLDLTGYSREEVIGHNCRFLQGPDTDPAAKLKIRKAMQAAVPVTTKILNYRKDGSTFWNLLHITPMFDSDRVLRRYIGVQYHLMSPTAEDETDAGKIAIPELYGADVVGILEDVSGVDPAAMPEKPAPRRGGIPTAPISLMRPSSVGALELITPDMDRKKSVVVQSATVLQRISATVEKALETIFFHLGRGIAKRPWLTIFIVIVLVGGCASGFSMYYQESRTEKLWVPQGTQTLRDQAVYEEYYGAEIRIESFSVTTGPGRGSDTNILAKPALKSLIQLIDEVKALEAFEDEATSGPKSSLADLCIEGGGDDCLILSILNTWEYNVTILENDNDTVKTLNDRYSLDSLETSLGGVIVKDDQVISATALKVQLFLENNQIVVDGQNRDPKAEGWELAFTELLLKTQEDATALVVAYPQTARSFSDVFGEAIRGDVALLGSSIMLIVAYTMLNIGRFHKLESGVLLSFGAVGGVGLAIAVSFGISSFLGQFYGPVHSVLPFLLIGLGVDDAFVIASAFRRTNHWDDRETRLSEALAHAGVSITVTSLTDFTAFLTGYFTNLPALSSFCVYAAVGVAALFLIQSTFFAAVMVLDAKRIEKHRYDCLPCFRMSDAKVDKLYGDHPWASKLKKSPSSDGTALRGSEGIIAKFLRRKYGPFITNKWSRPFVILIFAAMLAGGVYGFLNLSEDASFDAFVNEDTYFAKTLAIDEEYFPPSAITVDIVTTDIDYFKKQDDLAKVAEQLDGTAYLKPTQGDDSFFQSWYDLYLQWLAIPFNGHADELDENGRPPTEKLFYQWLDEYFEAVGGRISGDVIVERDSVTNNITKINAARMRVQYEVLPESNVQVLAMDALKEAVSTKMTIPAFPFTFSYLFWEQYKVIGDELRFNTISSLAAVFVITLILIAHPATSLLVFLCVAATVVDLAGVMFIWDVKLDSVAAVNLVLAVGLSVDYAAHIGHNFMLQLGPTKQSRAIQALGDIGAPVLNGAVSTFLAVCLLSLSKSYVFVVFFKMFFATGLLGVLHGTVLLPVLLSYFGPHGVLNQANFPPMKVEDYSPPPSRQDKELKRIVVEEPQQQAKVTEK